MAASDPPVFALWRKSSRRWQTTKGADACRWLLGPASYRPMHPEKARRGRLLYIALGFLGLDVPPAARPSGLRALHTWLDTWHGIGLIEHGLERQERDLSLTRYQNRWGAAVFVTGREHSITQGFGWQMTPWGAVQQAAFQALDRGRYLSDQPQVL
jgi:hypothetical protein